MACVTMSWRAGMRSRRKPDSGSTTSSRPPRRTPRYPPALPCPLPSQSKPSLSDLMPPNLTNNTSRTPCCMAAAPAADIHIHRYHTSTPPRPVPRLTASPRTATQLYLHGPRKSPRPGGRAVNAVSIVRLSSDTVPRRAIAPEPRSTISA